MNTLHIQYMPNLTTPRGKTSFMVKRFLLRFYTPTIFILWFMVAFGSTCGQIKMVLVLLSLFAATLSSHTQYKQWYSKILQMIEKPDISLKSKIQVMVPDFIIHVTTSFLGFWWVDDVHTCFNLDKSHQAGLWFIVLIVSFILHTVHHSQTHSKMQEIVQNVYSHVEP